MPNIPPTIALRWDIQAVGAVHASQAWMSNLSALVDLMLGTSYSGRLFDAMALTLQDSPLGIVC